MAQSSPQKKRVFGAQQAAQPWAQPGRAPSGQGAESPEAVQSYIRELHHPAAQGERAVVVGESGASRSSGWAAKPIAAFEAAEARTERREAERDFRIPAPHDPRFQTLPGSSALHRPLAGVQGHASAEAHSLAALEEAPTVVTPHPPAQRPPLPQRGQVKKAAAQEAAAAASPGRASRPSRIDFSAALRRSIRDVSDPFAGESKRRSLIRSVLHLQLENLDPAKDPWYRPNKDDWRLRWQRARKPLFALALVTAGLSALTLSKRPAESVRAEVAQERFGSGEGEASAEKTPAPETSKTDEAKVDARAERALVSRHGMADSAEPEAAAASRATEAEPRAHESRREARRRRARERAERASLAKASAVATAAKASGKAEAPGKAGPLGREAALRVLKAMSRNVHRCAPQLKGTVVPGQLVVAGSGQVVSASISGRLAGTKEGICMVKAMRSTRFPAFDKPKMSISYPFVL